VGDGDGPGVGPGKDGGCCGGNSGIGGSIIGPTVVYRVEPEYSEEARKARYQGTVVLQAIIRRDSKVDVIRLVRSLGYGLDQNASRLSNSGASARPRKMACLSMQP